MSTYKDSGCVSQMLRELTAVMALPSWVLMAESSSHSLSRRDRNLSRVTTWDRGAVGQLMQVTGCCQPNTCGSPFPAAAVCCFPQGTNR